MKLNPFACFFSIYWFLAAAYCGKHAYLSCLDSDYPVMAFRVASTLFLIYGGVRCLMREKPYTWKRERPFWLFMTKEERRNGR